jgi:hypothetical protein
MDDDERTQRIFQRVLDLTRNGELEWEQSGPWFEARFDSAHLRIASVDEDELPPFEFKILLPRNRETIAELRSASLKDAPTGEERHRRRVQNESLKLLFGLARRQALGIDSVFERLEQELEIDE